MSSFHNQPAQFRSFKRAVSLRLGSAPATSGSSSDETFELDAPGIAFGDDVASVIGMVFSNESNDTEEN